MRKDDTHVKAQTDKGLGPVVDKVSRYKKDVLVHLTNTTTYAISTEDQGHQEIQELKRTIFKWTMDNRICLSKSEVNYIRKKLDDAKDDPYGYFYLLYKIHKSPISTRPVCSDCASLPYALGQYVNHILQTIVLVQATCIKDSFSFVDLLMSLGILPPNASLFTYDAISMYTKIDTDDCVKHIFEFLLLKVTHNNSSSL